MLSDGEKKEHSAADGASLPGSAERCTKWRTFPDKTEGAGGVSPGDAPPPPNVNN